MPNSYVTFVANGSNATFSFAGIDDYLSTGYIKVYIDNVLQTSGYTIDVSGGNENVVFSPNIPAAGRIVKISRETPSTSAGFTTNIVDFSDGSVLTSTDLDKGFKGLLHIVQEANDTGSGALGKTAAGNNWDAGKLRITNLANGTSTDDAVTKAQLDAAQLYGSPVTVPQAWSFTANGSSSAFTLDPEALNTDPNMFIVEVGGILQRPTTDYEIASGKITFLSGGNPTAPANGLGIRVRNFGVARSALDAIPNSSVTNQYLATNAVATANIQNNAVTAEKLADNAVDSAALQDLSVIAGKLATDSIVAANIQNLQVTNAKIANNAVTAEKLGALSVGSNALADSAVSSVKLADGSINFSKMNTAAVGASLFASSGAADRYMKIATSGALSLDNLTNLPVGTPTQDVNFQSSNGTNGYTATNLRNPANARDAATKSFVETLVFGSSFAMLIHSVGTNSFNAASVNSSLFDLVSYTYGISQTGYTPRPKSGNGSWVMIAIASSANQGGLNKMVIARSKALFTSSTTPTNAVDVWGNLMETHTVDGTTAGATVDARTWLCFRVA